MKLICTTKTETTGGVQVIFQQMDQGGKPIAQITLAVLHTEQLINYKPGTEYNIIFSEVV